MNLYSTGREAFRQFITRHQVSRVIHGRTYVFVFVPLDLLETDRPPQTQGARPLIRAKAKDLRCPEQKGEGNGGSGEQQLNWDLMWTRFLPNPLWRPKERK
jgi:hypothetical protein